jgi:hypothetical protein
MPSLPQSISDRNKIYRGGILKETICQKDRRRHQYRDLIVISLKLHHKWQQQDKTRSKRPLKIAERLLGTGSIAAG